MYTAMSSAKSWHNQALGQAQAKESIDAASRYGIIEAIKRHLAAGADVNVKDECGRVPLLITAHGNHEKIAELLIAEGADVNVTDGNGDTPLHYAARDGQKEIAELLISNSADVNAKNKRGDTPLNWAISRKHPETAALLRKHGGTTGEDVFDTGN